VPAWRTSRRVYRGVGEVAEVVGDAKQLYNRFETTIPFKGGDVGRPRRPGSRAWGMQGPRRSAAWYLERWWLASPFRTAARLAPPGAAPLHGLPDTD
jgi:hypothetical protein